MVAHGLVEIQTIKDWSVVACKQFVRHDEDLRVFVWLLEQKTHVFLTLIAKLKLRNQGTINDVCAVFGINSFAPLGGQEVVQSLLVFCARFTVNSDKEGFISQRQDVLLEVFWQRMLRLSQRDRRP